MTEQAQGQSAPESAPSDAGEQRNGGGFTQEDVNKIAGTRAKEAKQAALNDLLQKAGAESVDQLLTAYNDYQAVQEATQTEADRERKSREKAEAKAAEAQSRYTNTLRQYAFRDALRDSGINPERIPGALRLADLDALEVDESGSVAGIEDAVAAVREASPEWFADTQEPRRTITSPQATREATPQGNSYEGGMASHIFRTLSGP
jgi:hypothetical protein